MKRTSFGAVCAAMLFALASMAHADATLSPGKNVAYTTLSTQPISPAYTTLAQVVLEKGKKKRVVEVDVTLLAKHYVVSSLSAYATINGVDMEPTQGSPQAMDNCNPSWIHCTISGTYWADLDALEAASPGSFIDQPLVIEARGTASAITSATVSVRARIAKK